MYASERSERASKFSSFNNFPVPSSLYKGPNEGLNVSLGHKGAPLPTLCLPYITVPRNQPKRHI